MSSRETTMLPYQQYIHLSRYARFRDDLGRRENWDETVDRYINFFKGRENLPEETWQEVRSAIYNMEVMPSMRALMSAGKALELENMCGYNCSYVEISEVRTLAEILYILMCGTGVGFSVERQVINKLPVVPNEAPTDTGRVWVVGDSKKGWAEAYEHLLESLWNTNTKTTFDYSQVRGPGERLLTMGGRASGPEPLRRLFTYTEQLFNQARGRRLTSVELNDLACMVGEIVVVGGVRRSAMISLSNLSDDRMRHAKSGAWYETHGMRSMANNSAVYTEKPDSAIFMKEWLALMESGSGERGIFNRQAAQKRVASLPLGRDPSYDFGTNPCGEIILRNKGLCNLSEVVVRPGDDLKDLMRKTRIASIIGTLQSTLVKFEFLSPEWSQNCIDERLLGVSLTGIMGHERLRCVTKEDEDWTRATLQSCRLEAHRSNKECALALGIEPSKAVTCIKPSGTVSLLVNCPPGIHYGYGSRIRRTIRNDMKDPMTRFLIEAGVEWEPCVSKPETTAIFSFYMESSDITIDDTTALHNCKLAKLYSEEWCDHNPSCTITIRDHEWVAVGSWVYDNFDSAVGMSFMPWFGASTYEQLPIQPLSEEEYARCVATQPSSLDWTVLARMEAGVDNVERTRDLACVSGVCEIS